MLQSFPHENYGTQYIERTQPKWLVSYSNPEDDTDLIKLN
jgi:hypothetical protein